MVAFGVLAALGATAPAEAVEEGGLGIRLTDVPPADSADPRAQIYVTSHVAPGSVVIRNLEVSNTTGDSLPVELFASAAQIVGNSFVGHEGRTENELSSWISVSPETAQLQPGGTAAGVIRITVPAAAATGERYAVVWVQTKSVQPSGGLTLVNRVGIRVYLSVGPGGMPPSDFTIESLTAKRSTTGIPSISARVVNTGKRALDVSGELLLTDGPGGLRGGPFPVQLGNTLAIGESTELDIPLDPSLPNGPWQAELTLRSGFVERTVHTNLTFPAPGQAAIEFVPSGWPSQYGIALVAGLTALLVAGITGVRMHKRRKRAALP
jgi:hypothetical protein